jgi:glycosyltransferase involved in cell wall biosynthesis
VQREVEEYLKNKTPIEIHSIWGGGKSFANNTIHTFSLLELVKLLYLIPYWSIKRPSALLKIISPLLNRGCSYFQNWEENLLGIAFGIIKAKEIQRRKFRKIHSIWATMPTSAAITIHKLTDIPYSMEGHAYDVFREGGDVLLDIKLVNANRVRTSCISTFEKLEKILKKQGGEKKLFLIRRGLQNLPECRNQFLANTEKVRILSVGRLTEKKGYREQLKIYQQLKRAKISFQATIIGGGELENFLRNQIKTLDLQDSVKLLGAQPFHKVEEAYKNNDLFLFTGKISSTGDRDGFPNVLGEAMARGLIVLSSPVADVCSAIKEGETGYLCNIDHPKEWVKKIQNILLDTQSQTKILIQARNWIEENFIVSKNALTTIEQVLLYSEKRK